MDLFVQIWEEGAAAGQYTAPHGVEYVIPDPALSQPVCELVSSPRSDHGFCGRRTKSHASISMREVWV